MATEFEQCFGGSNVNVGGVWSLVGRAHVAAGDASGARELLERALRSQAPPDSPKAWAINGNLLHNLGMAELGLEEFNSAEEHFRGALGCCSKSGEIGRSNSIVIGQNLAVALREQSRFNEAEELLLKAFQDSEKTLGPNHFHTANTVKELGELRLRAGRREDGSHHLKKSIKMFEASVPGMFPVEAKLSEARQLLASIEACP
jgi:tetratricopeptide (TPR) repeat protein